MGGVGGVLPLVNGQSAEERKQKGKKRAENLEEHLGCIVDGEWKGGSMLHREVKET